MADGDIYGTRRAWGQVAHTDGNATTVAQITPPTAVDGYYFVRADLVTGGSNATTGVVGTVRGRVYVDGGTVAVTDISFDKTDGGGSGYDATLDVSGTAVRCRVTAANNRRSVATIELFGVEQAITLA